MSKSCPRCGREVPVSSGRGRPAIWCSQDCRRAASSERLRASKATDPVQVVEVVRERRESLDKAVERVLGSPKAIRKVLEGAGVLVASGGLSGHAHGQVAPGVRALIQACENNASYRESLTIH